MSRYLLWGELLSAVAFGASWLMMGVEIDKKLRYVPEAKPVLRRGKGAPRSGEPALGERPEPPPGGAA
jgi:hypothetical protein